MVRHDPRNAGRRSGETDDDRADQQHHPDRGQPCSQVADRVAEHADAGLEVAPVAQRVERPVQHHVEAGVDDPQHDQHAGDRAEPGGGPESQAGRQHQRDGNQHQAFERDAQDVAQGRAGRRTWQREGSPEADERGPGDDARSHQRAGRGCDREWRERLQSLPPLAFDVPEEGLEEKDQRGHQSQSGYDQRYQGGRRNGEDDALERGHHLRGVPRREWTLEPT